MTWHNDGRCWLHREEYEDGVHAARDPRQSNDYDNVHQQVRCGVSIETDALSRYGPNCDMR